MQGKTYRRIGNLATGAALGSAVLLSGCVFNPIVQGHQGPTYLCRGTIYRYGRSTPAAPPVDGIWDSVRQHWCTSWREVKLGTALYADAGWVPSHIPGQLKGAHLLLLGSGRRTGTAAGTSGDNEFEVKLAGKPVDRIWIAFDERATTPPDWLTRDFVRTSPTVRLVSTQSYFRDGTAHRVTYALWAPKQGFLAYLTSGNQALGGNNAAGVAWSGGRPGAQYLVFIRTHPQPDRSTRLETLGTLSIKTPSWGDPPSVPESELREARRRAMARWLSQPAHRKYAQAYADGLVDVEMSSSMCSEIRDNVGGQSRALVVPLDDPGRTVLGSWVETSTGVLDPTLSSVTITVAGHPPLLHGGSGKHPLHDPRGSRRGGGRPRPVGA